MAAFTQSPSPSFGYMLIQDSQVSTEIVWSHKTHGTQLRDQELRSCTVWQSQLMCQKASSYMYARLWHFISVLSVLFTQWRSLNKFITMVVSCSVTHECWSRISKLKSLRTGKSIVLSSNECLTHCHWHILFSLVKRVGGKNKCFLNTYSK